MVAFSVVFDPFNEAIGTFQHCKYELDVPLAGGPTMIYLSRFLLKL
jgi:hypothetical protein